VVDVGPGGQKGSAKILECQGTAKGVLGMKEWNVGISLSGRQERCWRVSPKPEGRGDGERGYSQRQGFSRCPTGLDVARVSMREKNQSEGEVRKNFLNE